MHLVHFLAALRPRTSAGISDGSDRGNVRIHLQRDLGSSASSGAPETHCKRRVLNLKMGVITTYQWCLDDLMGQYNVSNTRHKV